MTWKEVDLRFSPLKFNYINDMLCLHAFGVLIFNICLREGSKNPTQRIQGSPIVWNIFHLYFFLEERRISLFESVLLSVKFALNYKFMRVLSILVDKSWKFSLHYNIEQYSYRYFWFNWIREKVSGLPGIIQTIIRYTVCFIKSLL